MAVVALVPDSRYPRVLQKGDCGISDSLIFFVSRIKRLSLFVPSFFILKDKTTVLCFSTSNFVVARNSLFSTAATEELVVFLRVCSICFLGKRKRKSSQNQQH